MAEKTSVSAKQVVADIRAGATDDFLMKKYGVSEKSLQSLFHKLVAAKAITQAELNQRVSAVEEVEAVIIEEEAAKPVPPSPISTQRVFKCPACGKPQESDRLECLDCGIIFSKFRSTSARTGTMQGAYTPGDRKGYVEGTLIPGEQVVHRGNIHWAI